MLVLRIVEGIQRSKRNIPMKKFVPTKKEFAFTNKVTKLQRKSWPVILKTSDWQTQAFPINNSLHLENGGDTFLSIQQLRFK